MSNDILKVVGNRSICGEMSVQGAKNSALPLLAATLITNGESVLHNCPNLSDCDTAIEILEHLGCKVKRTADVVTVVTDNSCSCNIPENLMLKMRSSIVFLGAILTRCKKARLSYPGGCELGPRPIDLHLSSLRKLGVMINEHQGVLDCTAPNGLIGTEISLSFPSVGATENIILAASMAKGETTINNAAQEPEIVDLAEFLNKCGAKIYGAGENKITIVGVKKLRGATHRVIADRIATSTYLCMAAGTKGVIKINDVSPNDLSSVIPVLRDMGCDVELTDNSIMLDARGRRLVGVKMIRTMPYPGFPTDAQPPLMAIATKAQGSSIFVENIFDNRFKHINDLVRMGADIKVEGRAAFITGVDELYGMQMDAYDLRGGAAIVTAALQAKGESRIMGVQHIDRGYQGIEKVLTLLGAEIERI